MEWTATDMFAACLSFVLFSACRASQIKRGGHKLSPIRLGCFLPCPLASTALYPFMFSAGLLVVLLLLLLLRLFVARGRLVRRVEVCDGTLHALDLLILTDSHDLFRGLGRQLGG